MSIYYFTTVSTDDFTSITPKMAPILRVSKIMATSWFQKDYTQRLSMVEVHGKQGFFFFIDLIQRAFHFVGEKTDLISTDSSQYFLKARLIYDTKKFIKITKVYDSLMSVLSFVGGLFKGMSMIFLCAAWPIREVEYYKQLINMMFNVCETQKDIEKAFRLDPDDVVDDEELSTLDGGSNSK